ncbi:formyltransferase family protein [Myroides odoratimimus]|uniref:formyltransferase family protein n=1 Tax=Myroides odoratimimus TaxID=76832 RepID=UPI00103F3F96|nr:formyltransferase family protein [Myroides odoratimimus]QBK77610.1 methionyl-tRNA formyltransferase [Myroides odoratimimus]WHT73057.1 formyltransferase family protein [Myroides odoratimimus]WHU37640.1 formyltransferase family protein [Myroides odoratimimus]
MKFGFVTCVQLGLSCIEEIYNIGGQLDVVITLKDEKAKSKSGRIYLDDISSKHSIPLFKINHINDKETIDLIKSFELDWLFIIGWSQIASNEVLESVKYGCVGMHPTLLPLGRGRAAIPWAIIKGLDKTGVSMFKLDEGVDTGDILGQVEIELDDKMTSTVLYNLVDQAHITLIKNVFPTMANDKVKLVEQDNSLATYWEGRTPKDGEINKEMTVVEVDRLVRATTKPYPGAFFRDGDKKVIVWSTSFVDKVDLESISFKLRDGFLIPQEYDIVDNE